jgi:NADH:ubiquinone oxidoreductase subunit K
MARRFYLLAAVLAVIGVLGFVTASPMFGVFETTPLLNAVHLGAAVLTFIAATRGLGTMRAWGQVLGYIFAALTIAGFATDADFVANLLPLSDSNAWFHLALTLVYLYHALLAPPTI